MAVIRGQATSGVAPEWVMMAPVTGVQKRWRALDGSENRSIYYELNEAFAVQALAVTRELGLDLDGSM
jgi:acetyl-CoA C-acetyltransferase